MQAYAADNFNRQYFQMHFLPSLYGLGLTWLGDNYIQNFHLGRYIVRYTIWNLGLWRHASWDVKRDFRPYIQQYTSPNVNFEYGCRHSNGFLSFCLKLERCKPQKAARHPTICDVINDVKLFPTVYTVANFWRYPIRRRVIKSSAFEFIMAGGVN